MCNTITSEAETDNGLHKIYRKTLKYSSYAFLALDVKTAIDYNLYLNLNKIVKTFLLKNHLK